MYNAVPNRTHVLLLGCRRALTRTFPATLLLLFSNFSLHAQIPITFEVDAPGYLTLVCEQQDADGELCQGGTGEDRRAKRFAEERNPEERNITQLIVNHLLVVKQ
jgi:hypothetical protein